jgi:hypothetical protein
LIVQNLTDSSAIAHEDAAMAVPNEHIKKRMHRSLKALASSRRRLKESAELPLAAKALLNCADAAHHKNRVVSPDGTDGRDSVERLPSAKEGGLSLMEAYAITAQIIRPQDARIRWICGTAVQLETCKTEEHGRAVHDECYGLLARSDYLDHDDAAGGLHGKTGATSES